VGMTDAETTGVDTFNDFEPLTQRMPSSK